MQEIQPYIRFEKFTPEPWKVHFKKSPLALMDTKGKAIDTLDVMVPVKEANHLFQRMLKTLNHYSGYTGWFEQRKMNCWVQKKKTLPII